MNNGFHLWPETPKIADGSVTLGVTLENPQGKQQYLWYRLPENYASVLATSSDPFIVALLFKMMHYNNVRRESAKVTIHGEVSPSLLRNLTEYQAIWTCWRPKRYKTVEMVAEIEREQPRAPASNKAISTFSGGLDSCFTALRHRRGLCHPRLRKKLEDSIIIQGFDVAPEEQDKFDRAAKSAQKMLDSLGMNLIPLVTNIRQLGRDWIDSRWADSHGTTLASCLMLFQGSYGTGLIPSSAPYCVPIKIWGSGSLTDPLLSNNSFSIVYDGGAFTRAEKAEQLVNWPEALEEMLVCSNHFETGRNCCRCEKCVRTILDFRSVGSKLPTCFAEDATNLQILSIGLHNLKKTQREELEFVLAAARKHGISDTWLKVLQIALFFSSQIRLPKELLEKNLPEMYKSIKGLMRSIQVLRLPNPKSE